MKLCSIPTRRISCYSSIKVVSRAWINSGCPQTTVCYITSYWVHIKTKIREVQEAKIAKEPEKKRMAPKQRADDKPVYTSNTERPVWKIYNPVHQIISPA